MEVPEWVVCWETCNKVQHSLCFQSRGHKETNLLVHKKEWIKPETFTLLRSYLYCADTMSLHYLFFVLQEIDVESQSSEEQGRDVTCFFSAFYKFCLCGTNTSIYIAQSILCMILCLTDGLRQPFLVFPGLQGVLWGPTHKPSSSRKASFEPMLHKGRLNSWKHFSLCE